MSNPRVELFGHVAAFDGDTAVRVGGPKQQTVLAVLCLDPGIPVSTDRLIDAVWGDEVPDRARRSLSTFVSNLRHELGGVLTGGSGAYTAALDRSQVDLCVFEDSIRAAKRSESIDPMDSAAHYRAGLELWTGMPFGGIDGHGVLAPEIPRLGELRLSALETVLSLEVAQGRAGTALPELETLLLEHPEHEKLRDLHMRALYANGRQSEALASYHALRDQLATLGLEPSPDLQDLELQILQHDPRLTSHGGRSTGVTEGPPAAIDLTIRTLTAVPVRYSSFIARGPEMNAIRQALHSSRLVTITGPGGIGKSSLAAQSMRQLRPTFDVAFLDVQALVPDGLRFAAAQALGLHPTSDNEAIKLIVNMTRHTPTVMLWDGCERMTAEVRVLAHELLSWSPELRLLITTRESLSVPGEHILQLGPLGANGPGSESFSLFLDRAQRVVGELDDADVRTVAEICRRLDGMPLAIEIAAAQTRVMPLAHIEAQLDELMALLVIPTAANDRHSSLGAAISWSYESLTAIERAAFRALAVFRGSFQLDGALSVIGSQDHALLNWLVQRSLVTPPDRTGRYRMLEPIRQFALAELNAAGESHAAQRRHALWAVAVSRAIHSDQQSVNHQDALSRLQAERTEIVEALRWSLDNDPRHGAEIVANLGLAFIETGASGAERRLILRIAEHPDIEPSPDLASASAFAAFWERDNQEKALSLVERGENIARLAGDDSARGIVLTIKATIYHEDLYDTRSALAFQREGFKLLKVARIVDAQVARFNLAMLLAATGRLDEAGAVGEELLQLSEAALGRVGALAGSAMTMLSELRGEMDVAIHYCVTACQNAEELGQERLATDLYAVLARLCMFAERYEQADDAVRKSRQVEQRLGTIEWEDDRLLVQTRLHAVAQRWDEVLSGLGTWASLRQFEEPALTNDASRPEDALIASYQLACALEAKGRDDDASALAAGVQRLIHMSPYPAWQATGEVRRWQTLQARLPQATKTGPQSVADAIDFIRKTSPSK